MKLEWYESRDFQWVLEDSEGYLIGQIKHYPIGWELQWRPNTARRSRWNAQWWPDTQLEEAKAWAIAMIRMSQ
jgi:hypothetical protein